MPEQLIPEARDLVARILEDDPERRATNHIAEAVRESGEPHSVRGS